jgi:CHAT domain-containing protein
MSLLEPRKRGVEADRPPLLSAYVTRALKLGEYSYKKLEHVQDESNDIISMYGDLGEQVADATELQVRAAIPGRRWIHLACHGLGSAQRGEASGHLALVPATEGRNRPDRDGLLEIAEVEELELTGCELVYLSACTTSFGLAIRGEAAWALARAFLVAGARRVVATCWQADDEAGKDITVLFFRYLRGRSEPRVLDYAKALRQAKRDVMKRLRTDIGKGYVWKWAPYIIVGAP